MKKYKSEYDLNLKNLLETVRKKGILVQIMPKGTSFIGAKREQYKKDLGAVPVRNILGDITNIYMVYEDFDGTIKYYDYPQYKNKKNKGLLLGIVFFVSSIVFSIIGFLTQNDNVFYGVILQLFAGVLLVFNNTN